MVGRRAAGGGYADWLVEPGQGLLCLFLPAEVIFGLLNGPLYSHYYYVSPVISLLVGLYLIYASSFGKADQATVK